MSVSSMPELSPKKRISNKIKSDLKQAILDGVYKPGDKLLPEVEIARQYGVSKVSTREALSELESEGLIVKKEVFSAVVLLQNLGPRRW